MKPSRRLFVWCLGVGLLGIALVPNAQVACPAANGTGAAVNGIAGSNRLRCDTPVPVSGGLLAIILSLLLDEPETLAVPNLPRVTSPVIDKFELVASDGDGTYIWNSWGWHQTRVTHHADGAIRVIYNVLNENGGDTWRLMKKQGDAGAWAVEASGDKFDDSFLLRDPVSDRAHVITSPNSVRTVYSSPTFAPVVLPGIWPYSSITSRQYSGAGIGADGTLCFKGYEEAPTEPVENLNTKIGYICGKMDASGTWAWRSKIERDIGPRYSYDYVFPGVQGSFKGFLATAQSDVHKIAAGWPNLIDNYVFDGVRFYKAEYASNASWLQSEIVPQFAASTTATVAPVQRQYDAFVDSRNNVIVSSFREHPADASVRGFYITVSDMNGNTILDKKLTVPAYGNVRVFESSSNQLWLLWSGTDRVATRMYLYPVTIVASPGFDFRISGYTDLSASAAPYRMQANVLLALPRGGNQKNNFIDGMMVACGTSYPSACASKDRILYFRIRLPGS